MGRGIIDTGVRFHTSGRPIGQSNRMCCNCSAIFDAEFHQLLPIQFGRFRYGAYFIFI